MKLDESYFATKKGKGGNKFLIFDFFLIISNLKFVNYPKNRTIHTISNINKKLKSFCSQKKFKMQKKNINNL